MASDVEVREREELAVPGTGELVDLSDPVACGMAYDALLQFEALIGEARRGLERAIIEHAERLGDPRIKLRGRLVAEVKQDKKTSYDADVLEERLRAAGMPDERINEIIRDTVTRSVSAVELKKAARMNPEYQAALEAAASRFDGNPHVKIRRA